MENAAKVLLVDDVSENLAALEALLKSLDIKIYCAQTAADALELMLEHDFAVAVVDVQMPEVTGFELAEMMRSTRRTEHIPIIFVTAGGDEAHAKQGYRYGAIDFLYKPLDNFAVVAKVRAFVDLYWQRALLREQITALQESQRQQQLLVDELRQVRSDLERAMRMRDEFTSVVSHELRTPLNTLKLELYARRTFLESGNHEAFSPARIEEMLDSDDRQLNRLVRLINDMTDVSRIRTGQLSVNPAPFDIVDLVRNIIRQFANQIEVAKCKANLHASDAITIVADEIRIEQAITNLLTNAIRHCSGKPIEVHVEDLGDSVRIAVRDYGRGVSPEDKGRIFHLFERGNHERKGSGLGLGLFIANNIVAAHGGRLTLEDGHGEGALFSLTLPKQHTPPADLDQDNSASH